MINPHTQKVQVIPQRLRSCAALLLLLCCVCVTPQTLDRATICGTLARLREEESSYIQLPYNKQNTLIHCLPVRTSEFNFINVHACNFMRFFQHKQQIIPVLDPWAYKSQCGY